MKNLHVLETEKNICPENHPVNFCWLDNPSIQKLLDAISSIIADEFIEIAKENKDIFLDSPHVRR
ncbi:MAG: hypothetical protein ABH836_01660 [Candidatus Omnitrophota bacterium]